MAVINRFQCIYTALYVDNPDPVPHQPQSNPSVELVTPLTYHKRVTLPGRWITHSPAVNSYYGLFQPQKMKGKLVTQPSKGDLVGKNPRNKYMLNHQQSTPDGSHVVTTLYKGDVNQTRSGGAQVRFTDTEVLHQRQGIYDPDMLARPIPKRRISKQNEYINQDHGATQPRVRFATLKDLDNKPAKPTKNRGILKRNKLNKEPEVRFATLQDVENNPSEYWARELV